MGPSKVPVKYENMKGTLKEMIKYSEEFRQHMLMEAQHLHDRINKLISWCGEMDVFLDKHMLERYKKRSSIEKKMEPLDKELKRLRKLRKKSKKAKIRNAYLVKIKAIKFELDGLGKKARRYNPV